MPEITSTTRALREPFEIGGVSIPNRVALAPLAGIGNWFVRLQARRHGAGLVVSEMVSSFAVHYGNQRTCSELLRIHPGERTAGAGGPISIQLFGQDADVMRSAAAHVAGVGAEIIDLNMGCPVPKVCKTGAGAALLSDPDRAVAVAAAAGEGSGLPVTVKLRSSRRPGDSEGLDLAHRLVEEAGVAAIALHPRPAAVAHRGGPDFELAARLAAELSVPVILTGGMSDAPSIRDAYEQTGVAAVMLARASLGNPWLFEEVLGRRHRAPCAEEVLDELAWCIDRAGEHLGPERAARFLRKFYPWYVARLELDSVNARRLQDAFQRTVSLEQARALIEGARVPAAA